MSGQPVERICIERAVASQWHPPLDQLLRTSVETARDPHIPRCIGRSYVGPQLGVNFRNSLYDCLLELKIQVQFFRKRPLRLVRILRIVQEPLEPQSAAGARYKRHWRNLFPVLRVNNNPERLPESKAVPIAVQVDVDSVQVSQVIGAVQRHTKSPGTIQPSSHPVTGIYANE